MAASWVNKLVVGGRLLQVLLGLAMLIVASLSQYSYNSRNRLYLLLFGITPTTLCIIGTGVHTIFWLCQENLDESYGGVARVLRWAADLFIALALAATIALLFIVSIDDGVYPPTSSNSLEFFIELLVIGANTILYFTTFIMLVVDHCRSTRREKQQRPAGPVIVHLSHDIVRGSRSKSHWSVESWA